MYTLRIITADLKSDLEAIIDFKNYSGDTTELLNYLDQIPQNFKRFALWLKVRNAQDNDIKSYIERFTRLNVKFDVSKRGISINGKRFIDETPLIQENSDKLLLDIAEYIDEHCPMLSDSALKAKKIEVEPSQQINGISVYPIPDINAAKAVGFDTPWCITKPGNGMLQSYRDTVGATFIFIVDSNQKGNLRKVAVQFNTNNISLTDLVNRTGTTLTEKISFTDKNGRQKSGLTWNVYKEYLETMGVDFAQKTTNPFTGEEELLFANRPFSEQEQLIKRELEKTPDLKLFIKWINSPNNLASRYIGLGKKLSNEIFDFIKTKNQLIPLLAQYVSTGIELPVDQENFIITNNQLKNTYAANQIIAYQQGQKNPRLFKLLDFDKSEHLKMLESIVFYKTSYNNAIQSSLNNVDQAEYIANKLFDHEEFEMINNFGLVIFLSKDRLDKYPFQDDETKEYIAQIERVRNPNPEDMEQFSYEQWKRSFYPREIGKSIIEKYTLDDQTKTHINKLYVFPPSRYLPYISRFDQIPERFYNDLNEDIDFLQKIHVSPFYHEIPNDNNLKRNLKIVTRVLRDKYKSPLEEIKELIPSDVFTKQNFKKMYSDTSLPQDLFIQLMPENEKDGELFLYLCKSNLWEATERKYRFFPKQIFTEKLFSETKPYCRTSQDEYHVLRCFEDFVVEKLLQNDENNNATYSSYSPYFVYRQVLNCYDYFIQSELTPQNKRIIETFAKVRFKEDKYRDMLSEKAIGDLRFKNIIENLQDLDDLIFLRTYTNYCAQITLSQSNPTYEISDKYAYQDKMLNTSEPYFASWLDNNSLKDENGDYFSRADKYMLQYLVNNSFYNKTDYPNFSYGEVSEYWHQDNVKPEITKIAETIIQEIKVFFDEYKNYCFACDRPNALEEFQNGTGVECNSCGAPDYRCPECDNNRSGNDEDCQLCGYPNYPCPECNEHGYSRENGCDSCGLGKTCPECGHTPYQASEGCENCGYPNPCPNCGNFEYSDETGCANCGHGQEGPEDEEGPGEYEDDEEIEPEAEEPIQASSVKFIKIANYLDDKGLYKIADRLFKLSKKL